MKIIDIFANNKLYAFQYKDEPHHELERLLQLWGDPVYLHDFIKQNDKDKPKDRTAYQFANDILFNLDELEDNLYEIANDEKRHFEEFFRPLHNNEYKVVQLSMQKGRKNCLRLYALKIDTNCFVLTGGAIKLTQHMEDRPHTLIELQKIKLCRDFLKSNGVFDQDSLYEFITQEL